MSYDVKTLTKKKNYLKDRNHYIKYKIYKFTLTWKQYNLNIKHCKNYIDIYLLKTDIENLLWMLIKQKIKVLVFIIEYYLNKYFDFIQPR